MDDHHSRQQLDELAELYLTSITGQAPESGEAPGENNALDGPAPIRLSPKLPEQSATPSGNHKIIEPSVSGDDRHPMLRLTDEDDTSEHAELLGAPVATMTRDEPSAKAPPQDRPAPQAVLEAVLMGNLPGMSGPWLTQYAQLLAQTEGPVALLHLSDSTIDLELIEPRAEAEPAPIQPSLAVRIPPMRTGMSGLVGLVDALVTSDVSPTRTVLVRIDTADDALTLSRLAAIDDWTVLCGSDDTAIASVVRQLRTVVRADPRLADRNVGLMVMGSEEAAARRATQQVAEALENDLAHGVDLVGHLKRMQPVQVREIASFADPVSVWPQLVSWFDTLEMPEPMAPAIDAFEPSAPEKIEHAAEAKKPAAQSPQPRQQKLSAQAAQIPIPTSTGSRPQATPQFRQTSAAQSKEQRANTTPPPITQATRPTRPAPRPRVFSPEAELDLVALLEQGTAALNDPVTLDARIPEQPKAQLVVDAHGAVHILSQHDAQALDTRQATMQLIEAGRWVHENLELIALTQRDRTFIDQEPVLHLMTGQADQATRLVGKLGGQVKLHLLQQVQLGQESGWFCTPLG